MISRKKFQTAILGGFFLRFREISRLGKLFRTIQDDERGGGFRPSSIAMRPTIIGAALAARTPAATLVDP